ncbi:MAG: acyl-CoA dehydrogenase family protein [Chloroflexota bacterium]
MADGDSWIINGNKMWMTNAGIADVMVVLVRTGESGSHSLSHILRSHGYPWRYDWPEKKMGLRGSPTHAVTFEDVRVPQGNLLGREGRGLAQTLTVLDGGRISIGALSIGLALRGV